MNRERQYIGARYVPTFYVNSQDESSAEWEANTSYERLTIVTYQNGSYISKKDVPSSIGNPAQNKAYWLNSGNYNGQIAHLQNEIDSLNDLVGDGELPHNEDTIIDSLQYLNDPYDYVVWIGDSYTGAASLGSDINKRYSTLVSAMLGLTEKNYAVGGCGFVQGPTPYTTQATNAVTDFTNNNLDKTKVKYAIIGGTRNDGIISGGDAATYESAVAQTITTLLNGFPNAEVIVLPMMWDWKFLPTNYLETIKRTKWAIKLADPQRKVRVIDNCYTWLSGQIKNIMWQDGADVHPNVTGHRVLASHVYSAIMGNNYSNEGYVHYGTWNSANDISNQHFTVDKSNGTIHIHAQVTMNEFHSTTLMTWELPINNDIEEFFFGDQRLWFNFETRNVEGGIAPAYLDCTVEKTGDHTGTITVTLVEYGGGMINGNTYYADLFIRDGVKQNQFTIS